MRNRADQSGKARVLIVFFIFILMSLTLVAGWWLGQRGVGGGLSGANEKPSVRLPFHLPAAAGYNSKAGDDRIADVAEAAMPAVVNIFSEKVVRQQPMADPMFRFFFGPEGRPRESLEHSLGSGVIVTPDGYILTNNHMVEGADSIKIATSDKRQFEARVIGTDPMTDLAVLKINAKDLPTLVLGDSDKVRVGEMVLAIGDPFGLSGTVTMGIVSARGRSHVGITDYEDFIQTDAAINPGNSGGALVNLRGELIGINTAIFSQSGGNMGIGFTIPSNIARHVMDSIVAHGSVKRGYLGVMLQDLTPDLASQFGVKESKGALVADVMRNSPASDAGIQPGDVITTINGATIENYSDLRNRIADQPPGANLEVQLVRAGVTKKVSVQLRERPAQTAQAGAAPGPGGQGQAEAAGIKVTNLTPQVADQLGLPADTPGIEVVDLAPGSPAERAGLVVGDIILMVNRMRVNNVEDFQQAVQAGTGNGLLLQIARQGQSLFLLVPLK